MILYAKPYVDMKIEELKERVKKLDKKPKLVIIRVEGDEASERYVRNKEKMCAEVGIESETIVFANDIREELVKDKIEELNSNKSVNGILLQLPLPKHLNEHYLTNLINPYKDVDGFTIYNMGRLALGKPLNVACTPLGIINFLKFNNIELKGKDVCIVNASNIVGKPLAHLFLQEGATPTICHKESKDVKFKIKQVDIVVLATGNADFVNADDLKEGQIVVDVSINFKNGKLCGDIKKEDYDKLVEKGVDFSPVPSGVGQLTVLTLIENTISIVERGL
jgi:methylenetetrahydrofolate dehydrogenase (NADP+)/methenyltetrahydrofolate cyclohydrolase